MPQVKLSKEFFLNYHNRGSVRRFICESNFFKFPNICYLLEVWLQQNLCLNKTFLKYHWCNCTLTAPTLTPPLHNADALDKIHLLKLEGVSSIIILIGLSGPFFMVHAFIVMFCIFIIHIKKRE